MTSPSEPLRRLREYSPHDLLVGAGFWLAYTDMIHTLRMHIGVVRKAIDRNVTSA
jgi:hypothetical protein